MNPFPLVGAMLRRDRATATAFVLLIALAVGLAAAITAQERALRSGSARAVDKFDLIVAAPGSQTDLLLKTIFLQPGSVELLQGEPLRRLMVADHAEFVAPIGFGDSYEGNAVVGTTANLVMHLAGGALEGRAFAAHEEAVAGSASPLAIGDTFRVSHGHGEVLLPGDIQGIHGEQLTVVGKLPPTGSPWDRALIVPIEFVWEVHGLGTGHAEESHADEPVAVGPDETPVTAAAVQADTAHPEEEDRAGAEGEPDHGDEHAQDQDHDGAAIGPPFDLATMPGVAAVVVKPDSVTAAYGLRNAWRTTETMAFFPAEVLVSLYELLGDVRVVMSALAIATQVLLIAAILAGIVILMRLYRQRFAILRALGASRSYVFAVAWCFAFALIAAGSLLGLGVGYGLAQIVSAVFAEASGIGLSASIGRTEILLALAISAVGAVLATIPAALLYRQPVVPALRQG